MVTSIAHGGCGLVLASTAAAHLRRPRLLARALAVHGVAPVWAWRVAPPAVVAVETAVAAALLGSALTPAPAASRRAGTAASVLFAVYAAYLGVVARGAPEGAAPSCGCGVGEAPVGTWTIARAVALAATAAAGGLHGEGAAVATRPVGQRVAVAGAAATVAVAAALVPTVASRPR